MSLTLHDISGRCLRVLASGNLPAGRHTTALDAADLPAGVYLLRLEAGDRVKVATAVVVK